jgi:hypothetical protein
MNLPAETMTPTKAFAELAALYPAEVSSLLRLPKPEAVELLHLAGKIACEDQSDPVGTAAAKLRDALGLDRGDTETITKPLSPAESDLYDSLCAEVLRLLA